MPVHLPESVVRYLRAAIPDPAPRLSSAVIVGTGQIRLGWVWLPVRFQFALFAGQGYRHRIEVVWWERTVLRADELYRDGHAHMKLPFSSVSHSPRIDQAANVALWAESVWVPSALADDPRIRWQELDECRAQLIVPSPEGQDAITFVFDPETWLPARVEALRYKRPSDVTKTSWQVDLQEWGEFRGVKVPCKAALRWLDERQPWLRLRVTSVSYNLDDSALTTMSI